MGSFLDDIEFVLDENGILMSLSRPPRKQTAPIKGTVSAKGIVYAVADEATTSVFLSAGKFSFKSTIKFLGKQHP